MNQYFDQASNNPYARITAQLAAEEARAAFIRKTYLHLLAAILACATICALILALFDRQLEPIVRWIVSAPWHWLLVLGGFMVVSYIAERWATSETSEQKQYMGLGLYVVAEALLFIPLLWIAEHFAKADVIQTAGVITAIIFGTLTLVVFITKTDFSFLRWALVFGSVAAMGAIVAGCIFGFSLGLWFSVAMVGLASISILYNTSNIMHRYRTDQHVAASLFLFASVALLFWYVLQILMSMDD
ncbi:MAG: Bax inhibitor-1 family protein [Planctomycetota bacterium]